MTFGPILEQEPINTFSKISVSSCIIQKGFICIFLCSLLSEFTIAYLDIIHRLRQESELPIAAYNVSGEYSMIKAASQNKWLNEKRIVLETLMSMKRAGANAIISYYAKDALKWMK